MFYAELNELLMRELGGEGYSGVEVRPKRSSRAGSTARWADRRSLARAALHVMRARLPSCWLPGCWLL